VQDREYRPVREGYGSSNDSQKKEKRKRVEEVMISFPIIERRAERRERERERERERGGQENSQDPPGYDWEYRCRPYFIASIAQ
jgi:hypothetical protein